jgi:hypothetical protein
MPHDRVALVKWTKANLTNELGIIKGRMRPLDKS